MNRARQAPHIVFKTAACSLLLSTLLGGCFKAQDPAALVAQAKQDQQKGETKAAIIELKNALEKNPDDGEARLLLGSIYLESGDILTAEKELRKAASLKVASDRVKPPLCRALLALGKYQEVLDQTASDNQSAQVTVLRGDALLAVGKRDDARAAFQKALVQTPDLSAALVGLGRLAAVDSNFPEADKFALQATTKNPQDGDSWTFRGDLMRSTGRPDEAVKAYDEASRLQPKNINPILARAAVHISERQFDAAKADIAAANKIKANSLPIYYTQALLDYNQGNNAAALASLQQVLKAVPGHMPSLLLAGAVEVALGSNEQAEHYLKSYLENDSGNLYARKLLASVLMKNGQQDRAATVVGDALKDAPRDPQLYIIAGQASLQNKQFAKASDFFEKANAVAPKAALVHTALGMSKLAEGDNVKGVSELELAASLDPKSVKAGSMLVITQMRLKQFDKAMESVKSLEKQQPNDPLVQNLKGGVYLGMRDNVNARASFEKAVVLSPTYFPAIENLAQMDVAEKHPQAAKNRFEALLAIDKRNVQALSALAELAQNAGRTAEATSLYEKAASENPGMLPPSLSLATHYLRIGDKAKALTLAQTLYAANDTNPDVLDVLGRSQIATGDKTGALITFKKLAGVRPNSAAAQLRLASTQLMLNNETEAIAALDKALVIQPDSLEAQVELILLNVGKNKFDAAMKIARDVQKQRTALPIGWVLEGDIDMAQKNPAQAVKAYTQALTKADSGPLEVKLHQATTASGNGQDADARLTKWLAAHPADAKTAVYFADSLSVRHLNKAAIAQYEIVAKANPQDASVLNNLAYAYQEEKDLRALETAEQALKLAPTNPSVMDTVGWILTSKGPDPRGLELLKKASAQVPGANDVHLHLATALIKAGDKAGARTQLEPLAGSKNYARSEEAQKLLNSL